MAITAPSVLMIDSSLCAKGLCDESSQQDHQQMPSCVASRTAQHLAATELYQAEQPLRAAEPSTAAGVAEASEAAKQRWSSPDQLQSLAARKAQTRRNIR